ncbi:hypothetical protein K1719_002922 [Acacia pycnantha]|nr:hypothetical protein K1719_002922 [Acacia pycnantha]
MVTGPDSITLVLWRIQSGRQVRGVTRKALSLRCRAQTNPGAVVAGAISSSLDDHSSLVVKPALKIPLIQESAAVELLKEIQNKISHQIVALQTQQCFNILGGLMKVKVKVVAGRLLENEF